MAHLFWSPEGDAMPDVPVHGPACQGVESVVEEAAVDAISIQKHALVVGVCINRFA
jgi:hypothetical protein